MEVHAQEGQGCGKAADLLRQDGNVQVMEYRQENPQVEFSDAARWGGGGASAKITI